MLTRQTRKEKRMEMTFKVVKTGLNDTGKVYTVEILQEYENGYLTRFSGEEQKIMKEDIQPIELTEVIKRYPAKSGEVTVTRYTKYQGHGGEEFHVGHSNPLLPGGEWFQYKSRAIAYAQFLRRY